MDTLSFIIDALGYAFYMMWIFRVPALCIIVMSTVLWFFGLRWIVDRFGEDYYEI